MLRCRSSSTSTAAVAGAAAVRADRQAGRAAGLITFSVPSTCARGVVSLEMPLSISSPSHSGRRGPVARGAEPGYPRCGSQVT